MNTTSEKIAYLIKSESDLKTNEFNTINKSLKKNFIAIRFDKLNKSIENLIKKEQHKIGIHSNTMCKTKTYLTRILIK